MGKSFYHHGSFGDIIYALPTIRAMGGGAFYTRPVIVRNVRSLLLTQGYIEDVCEYTDRMPDILVMDSYRKLAIADPNKHLVNCHAEALGATVDRAERWLTGIAPSAVAPIVVNRTFRYNSGSIDWRLLAEHAGDVTFIGLELEHQHFVKKFFDVKYTACLDLLDAARVIAGSRLFVGNQSVCYAMAEGMKVQRVLEAHTLWRNCLPCEPTGGTALSANLIERCLA